MRTLALATLIACLTAQIASGFLINMSPDRDTESLVAESRLIVEGTLGERDADAGGVGA